MAMPQSLVATCRYLPFAGTVQQTGPATSVCVGVVCLSWHDGV